MSRPSHLNLIALTCVLAAAALARTQPPILRLNLKDQQHTSTYQRLSGKLLMELV